KYAEKVAIVLRDAAKTAKGVGHQCENGCHLVSPTRLIWLACTNPTITRASSEFAKSEEVAGRLSTLIYHERLQLASPSFPEFQYPWRCRFNHYGRRIFATRKLPRRR